MPSKGESKTTSNGANLQSQNLWQLNARIGLGNSRKITFRFQSKRKSASSPDSRNRSARAVPLKTDFIARLFLGLVALFVLGEGLFGQEENFFRQPDSFGTRRETEPPRYVRSIGDIEFFQRPEESWLDLGLDYRMRYEYRQKDIRRPITVLDEPFLTRTRAYIGIREKFDPLRGVIEFEDARRTNSQFPEDLRDVNETEIIQAHAELYFADALGEDRPFRFQAGRFAFEYVDRRLIARNEWRNTTNNFQGFRAIFGQQKNDWQLDFLAVQPVERLLTRPDRPNEEMMFYGLIGDWRKWSDIVTLQPYYLFLDEDGKEDRISREIHTLAIRGYGRVGESGFDFDQHFLFQFGKNGFERHEAYAQTSEIGYTWDQPWKPRWSVFFGYASGDRDPNDNRNQAFNRLFGFNRPWSASDYITFTNLITQKTRVEFAPTEKSVVELSYGGYWLASRTDGWENARLRDPTGQSGRLIGQELDIRYQTPLTKRSQITLGYAHFIMGDFPKNQGRPANTDFFYVELQPRLFP